MTLHEICLTARKTTCVCGALVNQPCKCPPGSYHLARFAHAARAGLITHADFSSVIADADVFTGTTCVLDPAEVGP